MSRQPPYPTLQETGSALPTNGYSDTSPQMLCLRLEARIRVFPAEAVPDKAAAQNRYKRDYG